MQASLIRTARALALAVLPAAVVAHALGAQTRANAVVGVAWSSISYASSLDETNHVMTHDQTGLIAGIEVTVPLSPTLVFAPDLIYVHKGYHSTEASPVIGPLAERVNLAYIELPALIDVRVIRRGVATAIVLGPSVSFNTSCSFASGVPGGSLDAATCQDDVGNTLVKRFDWSGVAGVTFARGRVSMSIREEVGAPNVASAAWDAHVPGTTVRNRALEVFIGIGCEY